MKIFNGSLALRTWHKRFLGGLTFTLAIFGASVAFRYVSSYLTSLVKYVAPVEHNIIRIPVKWGFNLVIPCQVQQNLAAIGYNIIPPLPMFHANIKDCAAECLRYENCFYYSLHRLSEEDTRLYCHIVSGLDVVELRVQEGARVGISRCYYSESEVTLNHRGFIRPGDQTIERVSSPYQCNLECQKVPILDCLMWTFSRNDHNRDGDCILHRALRATYNPETNGETERWIFHTSRVADDTALVGPRVFQPYTWEDLMAYVEDKYDVKYNDEREVGPIDEIETGLDHYLMQKEWFYSNLLEDGGPFYTDNRFTILPKDAQCDFGLVAEYNPDDLLSLYDGHGDAFVEDNGLHLTVPNDLSSLQGSFTFPDIWLVDGLWVIDIAKLPTGCGVSYKMRLDSDIGGGELDLMRGSNYMEYTTIALRSLENKCDMSLPLVYPYWHPLYQPVAVGERGLNLNCFTGECEYHSRKTVQNIKSPIPGSGGHLFNQRGGQIIIVHVDREKYIKVWFLDRDALPVGLVNGDFNPDEWAFKPTEISNGSVNYLPPLVWYPFMRGCESVRNGDCKNGNANECAHLIDDCEANIRDIAALFKSSNWMVYNPVGCKGLENFNKMRLTMEINICTNEASTWQDDRVCKEIEAVFPEGKIGDYTYVGNEPEHCLNKLSVQPKLATDSEWIINKIKLYRRGYGICDS